MLKAVISSHLNPNLSGVAKFNHILASHLGVPCMGFLDEPPQDPNDILLLSVKVKDMSVLEQANLCRYIKHLSSSSLCFDVFFHTFDSLEAEHLLIESCRQIFCGNSEIVSQLIGTRKRLIQAWCPFLVDPSRMLTESTLNLFAFGMAHKIKVSYYRRLAELLESGGLDYSLWMSTAFHEKASFGDFDSISQELVDILGDRVQFMGFLSDDAINYFLHKSHLFVAFFDKGVRANNTSVSAAMSNGCAVLTNLDDYSPAWMRHRKNVLDINQVISDDFDAVLLQEVGNAAKIDSKAFSSWESLLACVSREISISHSVA
jgi:hypothetical protein